jgi:DNA-binding GntR family transcriptional regulator
LLCEFSGNEKLAQVHRRLVAETGRFQSRTVALRGNLEGSVSEHRAILSAMKDRNVDAAAALAAAHVRVPGERLRESLGAQGWDALTASNASG